MTRFSVRKIPATLFVLLCLAGGFVQKAHAQDEYEKWKENYLQEFKEFQNKYDKQFHQMLQKQWKEFSAKYSPDFYNAPKPKVIPKSKPDTAQSRAPEPTIKLKTPEEKPSEKQKRKRKGRTNKQNIDQRAAPAKGGITPSFNPEVKKAKVESNNLTYFDVPIRYKYYAAYKTKLKRPVNSKSIAKFWKHLSTKDYPSFLDQIREVRARLSLNDYGYGQLLYNIGSQIYGDKSPEATLFTWFMLTQSGYGTRVAYNKKHVYLLIRTTPGLLATSYYLIDGYKYYGINFNKPTSNLPSRLYTYGGEYPKSKEKKLNLLFSRLPALPEKREQRTFSFSYHDTTYTFDLPVDEEIIRYFQNYPKAELELYFHSRMRGEMHQELLGALRPLIQGKSNVEKANILLRFVQNAFDYERDQEQFNTEKKMFPAETLYYPASDCDDRAILFAYLIEYLTDLDYIVVRYPGHLTTALHFPNNPPKGPRVYQPITYNGKDYYVSDPTYYGADAGMVMSKYQGTPPSEIFDL